MSGLAWQAKWISLVQHPAEDLGVFRFRREFEWDGRALTVKVSADQRYKLYVNGNYVGEGPQRGDMQHWFYETYELTNHLVEGQNLLEAVVWNMGRYAPMAQIGHRTAFVLEGGDISTPNGWSVARDRSVAFEMMHADVGPFYIDVGPGECVQTVPIESWREPNVIGHVLLRGEWHGDSPWWLVPRSIPAMTHLKADLRPLVVNAQTNERTPLYRAPFGAGEPLLLDLGELHVGYPKFAFSGPAPSVVSVTYGEAAFAPDGHKGDRNDVRGKRLQGYQDRFTLTAKHEQFSTLWWRTARYLQLESDQKVELSNFEWTETGYPYNVESHFRADDPWVEKIWDVGIRTLKLCAGETYFDCPYYEQLQYVGDTRIQALAHRFLSRDARLADNAVEQIGWSITPEGLTQSRYPTRVQQVIPGFSLIWALMVQDQALYGTPDPGLRQMAERVVEAVPESIGQHWWFLDWVSSWPAGVPPFGGEHVSFRLLTALAQLALGNEPGPIKVEKEQGLIVGTPAVPPSEHTEALWRLYQAASGHAPDPWPQEALDRATCYFSYYKHLAMRPDDYMAEMEPWKEMIRNGLTTFAESPEPTRSDCHAWSAHPVLGFFQIVAGVSSTGPGWSSARIEPRPGRLKWFDCTIAHPLGDLKVNWDGTGFEVDSPVPYEFVWEGLTSSHPAGRDRFTVGP